MGITDLLKELPGGNAKTFTRYGFANLAILRSFPASIDTGTLVFICVLRHKEAYSAWDYIHAAREYVDPGVGPQSNGEAPQAGESTGSSSGESRPRPLPPSLRPLPSRRTLTRPAQTPRSARC